MPWSEYDSIESSLQPRSCIMPKRTAWLQANRREHSASMQSCKGEQLGSFNQASQKCIDDDDDDNERTDGDEGPAVCPTKLCCEVDRHGPARGSKCQLVRLSIGWCLGSRIRTHTAHTEHTALLPDGWLWAALARALHLVRLSTSALRANISCPVSSAGGEPLRWMRMETRFFWRQFRLPRHGSSSLLHRHRDSLSLAGKPHSYSLSADTC